MALSKFIASPFNLRSLSLTLLLTTPTLATLNTSVGVWNIVSTLSGRGTQGYAEGTALTAQYNRPNAVAVDPSGNVYVADANNNRVRKVAPDGSTTLVIGNGTTTYQEGTGASAQINGPRGIAIGKSGDIYVSDWGNSRIRKITPDGTTSLIAGGPTTGLMDGTGPSAQFNGPYGIALDERGNLYVPESFNYAIRKITPNGITTTLAGNGVAGYAEGQGANAQFSGPSGVAVDKSGVVYVADSTCIRKILPDGTSSLVAGLFNTPGYVEGTGTAARFSANLRHLAIDSAGIVYMADGDNYRIRKLMPDGTTKLIAGIGGPSVVVNGIGAQARFGRPAGVTVDQFGTLYIADTYNYQIRKIDAFQIYINSTAYPSFDSTISLERATTYTRMDSDPGGIINTNGYQLTFGKTDGSTVNSTFNGVIIGTGGLTVADGILTLTGTNTYLGETTLQGGTLVLNGSGSLPSTTKINLAGGTLTLNGTGSLASTNAINLTAGTLDISTAASNQAIGALSINNGATLNLGARDLTFGSNGALIIAGTIASTGGGITKQGSGVATLSGTQGYTGPTIINAGTLHIKSNLNSASAITVASGAILSSSDTVSVGPVTASGTVLPSYGGTLTINGNYTLNANALHQVTVDSAGKLGLVHATNNVSLNGKMLILPADNHGFAFKEGQEYVLIQADGTLTDNLQNMSIKGASFLVHERVIKNGKVLALKVKSNSLTSQANISSFGVHNSASQALTNTLSDRMVLFASTRSLSSSSAGGSLPGQGSPGDVGNKTGVSSFTLMHNNIRAQVRSRTQPSRSLLQTGPAPKDEALARLLSTMESQGTQALKKDAYTLWVSALYTQGKNDKTAISSASSDHQHGAVIGFEYVTPNKQLVGISLAAGLGHSHARANRDNKSDHKYSQIGVYHSVEFLSNIWLNSQLAYSYMRSENQRLAIPPLGSSFLAHSASRLHSMNLVEELAYALKLTEATTLRIGYGFNYWRLHRGAYGEGDTGALAQFFPRITRHGFAHQATARLHYGWNTESYHLGLAGSLKYALTVSGYRLKDTVYTVGGPDAGFAITAPGLGRGTLSPSLTFSGQHKDKGPKLSLSYTANLQVKRKAHELYLEARWSF